MPRIQPLKRHKEVDSSLHAIHSDYFAPRKYSYRFSLERRRNLRHIITCSYFYNRDLYLELLGTCIEIAPQMYCTIIIETHDITPTSFCISVFATDSVDADNKSRKHILCEEIIHSVPVYEDIEITLSSNIYLPEL